MRVLQLIDSLEVGGAETIAVNYANALSEKTAFSGLIATRKSGALKKNLQSAVVYDCLEKKRSFDIKAIQKLKKFTLKHKVEIIHAHGTSYFTAFLLKIVNPKVKIIWHEHYGARVNQTWRDNLVLWICSFFFKHIFVVNLQLEAWMKKNMGIKKVTYIPNFAVFPMAKESKTVLSGASGKRIVCLANLKHPKNHLFLLKAFYALKLRTIPFDWSLHLIGKDFEDDYSATLHAYIEQHKLQEDVFMYGLQTDIENILQQAEIGVLASSEEGFPIALLEYALAGIPVVSTNAGYCSSIIKNDITGLLFDPADSFQLEKQLQKMISDTTLRETFAKAIKQQASNQFSEEKVIALLISKYSTL